MVAQQVPGAEQAIEIHVGETLCLVGTRKGDRYVYLRAVGEATADMQGVQVEFSLKELSSSGGETKRTTWLRVKALDGAGVAFQYAAPFAESDYLLGGRAGFIDNGVVILPPSFLGAPLTGNVPRAVAFDLRRGDAYRWPEPDNDPATK